MKQKETVYPPIWELNPIWQALTEEERAYISEHLELVRFAKNAILHYDGEESHHVAMLLNGKVRLYKEGVGQRQQIIRMLKPYDIFGYRACIAEGAYNSSASALEDCVVYRLKRDIFNQLIQQNGRLCFEITRKMARDLAMSEIRTVNLTQKHIRGRLAESLLLLLNNY